MSPSNAASPSFPAGRNALPTFCMTVRTLADPGALPRVLEIFAKRGMVPAKLFSVVTAADELTVDLQVNGLDEAQGDLIASQLRSQVGIETVLTSVKSEG